MFNFHFMSISSFLGRCAGEETEACHTLFRPSPGALFTMHNKPSPKGTDSPGMYMSGLWLQQPTKAQKAVCLQQLNLLR